MAETKSDKTRMPEAAAPGAYEYVSVPIKSIALDLPDVRAHRSDEQITHFEDLYRRGVMVDEPVTIIGSDGVDHCVDGRTRIEAAKRIGMTSIMVKRARGASDVLVHASRNFNRTGDSPRDLLAFARVCVRDKREPPFFVAFSGRTEEQAMRYWHVATMAEASPDFSTTLAVGAFELQAAFAATLAKVRAAIKIDDAASAYTYLRAHPNLFVGGNFRFGEAGAETPPKGGRPADASPTWARDAWKTYLTRAHKTLSGEGTIPKAKAWAMMEEINKLLKLCGLEGEEEALAKKVAKRRAKKGPGKGKKSK